MKKIFSEGKACNKVCDSVLPIINFLKEKREYLHNLKIDDIIDYLDKIGKSWLKNNVKIQHNLNHLVSFMSKENLINMLNISLRGNYKILDEFVELSNNGRLYHVQPRGLAVHWLAGNVPILGMFSIIQSLLTKNVSLIKASSRSYKELIMLLNTFKEFDTNKIKGIELARTLEVVLVDNSDYKTHESISMNADVRVAWGGHESMNTIVNLKKKFFCEDIIYGPKYSYAVIGKSSLIKHSQELARRIAFDISIFDQYACSSPHTLFIEENTEFEPVKFAQLLAAELDKVNKLMMPKGATTANKSMEILNLRTEYLFKGKVFSSKNTDWTVIYSKEEGLANACFSRVVFVRPIKDLKSIKYLNDRYKQTIGLAIDDLECRKRFADEVTLFGVDRCPKIGYMTLFESPWDGMFAIDRLVRWVAVYK